MTTEEMAVKAVCAKYILGDLIENEFWRNLINGDVDRLLAATQRALDKLPYNGKPKTDEEANNLIFQWTIPVRAEILFEFLPDNSDKEV